MAGRHSDVGPFGAANFKAENQEAHAGITKNVDGVKQDIRDVKQDVREVKQDVRMLTSHLLNRAVPPDA